jgi:hypothetical protein
VPRGSVVPKVTRGYSTGPYYAKYPQAPTDSYYPGRAFSRGARPTPTDHLPMLAPGTPTPNPLILGRLFRLVMDRCDDLGFPWLRTRDICGRLALFCVIK